MKARDTLRIREAMQFASAYAADYRELPSSLPEAREMRSAAIVELGKIHERLPKSQGLMREHLKAEARKTMQRITAVNDWIAGQHPQNVAAPKSYTVNAAPLTARPVISFDPKPERREVYESQTCACGEEVTPDRLRDSWVFYCQNCDADWSTPAPREASKPKPRRAVKRCTCSHQCRFCGGERGKG